VALTLVSTSRFGDHLTPPGHPESPDRAAILDGVAQRARDRGVAVIEPREATDAELERVHTPAHVRSIEATRGRATMLDADTTAGLIALSGAREGDVARALTAGRDADARALLERWLALFDDRYYLEVQRTGLDSWRTSNARMSSGASCACASTALT